MPGGLTHEYLAPELCRLHHRLIHPGCGAIVAPVNLSSNPAGAPMDPETVDQNYAQLEQEAQQTTQLIQTLAGKLQAASAAGDPNAREWLLDLKEITIGVQQEQGQTSLLLQSIHAMVDTHVQATNAQPQQQPQYQQPPQQYQQQPQYQQAPMMGGGAGGGMLQRFLGGGMGRAIMTGAGFGIGDDLINHIL
jgi:hypothetical protein